MTDQQKPREFWIHFKAGCKPFVHTTKKHSNMSSNFPGIEVFHVIEKRAYIELAEKLKKLTEKTTSYAESGCIEGYFYDDGVSLGDVVEECKQTLAKHGIK